MGAGAGYTLELKDCSDVILGDAINGKDLTLEKEGGSCAVIIKGDVCQLTSTVNAASDYYGTDDIKNVAIKITEVVLDLGIGNGYNQEILTEEAVEKYEKQFCNKKEFCDEEDFQYEEGPHDINDLWKELIEVLTIEDIDKNYIKSELSEASNYAGSGNLGGGWVHSTFDGNFELDRINSRSGYNSIDKITGQVVSQMVIDFIDQAVTGDNVEYDVYFNGDGLDGYDELDKAIEALKEYINKEIADGNVEDINFSECTVERYYYLRNGSEDNWEYETDFDVDNYVEYTADSDPDYEQYVTY